MILVLWLGRLLDRLCVVFERIGWGFNRAADRVYRVYFARENRKALRDERSAAIDDLIAGCRSPNEVRAPIHRDR